LLLVGDANACAGAVIGDPHVNRSPGVAGVTVAVVQHGSPHPEQSLPAGITIQAVAYSPDGQVIAAGGEDNFTFLRDARTGRLLERLKDPGGGPIDALAYRPDGKVLATGDDEGKVVL
jgi:WD40 repeat protein